MAETVNPAIATLEAKAKSLEKTSKAKMAVAERSEMEFHGCLVSVGALEGVLAMAIDESGCKDYHQDALIDWKGEELPAGEIVERSVRAGEVDDKYLETPKQLSERASRGLMEVEHEKPRANPAVHERRHAMERELFDYRKQMADHRLGATDEKGEKVQRPLLSEQWRYEIANRVEHGIEREAPAYADAMKGAGAGIELLSIRREAYERIELNNRQVAKCQAAAKTLAGGGQVKAESLTEAEQTAESKARSALKISQSEDKLIGILERSGMLDGFIDQVLARQGMSDHYRDTKLMGGTTTTGRAVQGYLDSSLNIAANDANHDTEKKQAEGHSLQAMLEAHGDAASHERDAGPRVAGSAKKQSEIDLYQHRQALADHVIEMKSYDNLTRGMTKEQIEHEGYAKPAKPELPESWRQAVCSEAAMTAIGRREAEREPGGGKIITQDWPWTKLPGQDRAAALGAMVERQSAIKGGREDERARQAKAQAAASPEVAAKTAKARAAAGALRSLVAEIEAGPKAAKARQEERGG